MRYVVVPCVGAGSLRLGMHRDEVRERLGEPDDTLVFDDPAESQDWWPDDGVSALYDADGACIEIALYAPATAAVGGVRVLGGSADEARAALRALDPACVDEEGLCVARAAGLALVDAEEGGLELIVTRPERLAAAPDDATPGDAAPDDAARDEP